MEVCLVEYLYTKVSLLVQKRIEMKIVLMLKSHNNNMETFYYYHFWLLLLMIIKDDEMHELFQRRLDVIIM